VGRLLYSQAAQTLKRVSLELGGNAPFLVFEDADIGEGGQGGRGVRSSGTPGRPASATNRVLVQESIQPRFTEAFSDSRPR